MKRKGRNKGTAAYNLFVALAAVTYLLMPQPAYAYLDPGTGGYILQLLAAAAVGAAFAIKAFWHNIKAYYNRLINKDKNSGNPPDNQNTGQ